MCAVIPVPIGSPVEKPPGGGGTLHSKIGANGAIGPIVGEVLLDLDGVVLDVATTESSCPTVAVWDDGAGALVHATAEVVVADPTSKIVGVDAAGFMCARRDGGDLRHALRSSPMVVEAPLGLLGSFKSVWLLILILSVFLFRGRLKTTLHWAADWELLQVNWT